jgi:hypothetical protein
VSLNQPSALRKETKFSLLWFQSLCRQFPKAFPSNPALNGMTLKGLVVVAAAAGLFVKTVALVLQALFLGFG